jgi:septum formation protein
MLDIILASASPRRKRLLEQIGLKVQVIPSGITEQEPSGSDFVNHVCNMATAKARKVAAHHPDQLVIGADTLVVCKNYPMGKPRDQKDASDMLTRLSGSWHDVISGVCLIGLSQQMEILDYAQTAVQFFPLSKEEIADYLGSEEPFDKAGAYGIQGLGARFVKQINGCFYNVVGLPLGMIWQHIKSFPEVSR